MKGFFGLAVVIFAAVAVAAATGPGPVVLARRHIAFNETYSVWMTAKEVEALTVDPNVHFMDITDFPSLGAVGSVGSDAPFPNQPMQKELVEAKIRNLDVANLEANLLALTNFYTRYYTSDTGVEAADWIYATLTSYAGARTDITVEYFTNTFPQPSVIARIAGTSDPDDRVILGSHIDSVGSTSTGRAPGADDDGSGTVCNLEVFRVLAQSTTFRPNKTLEFHFYAAEEAGLLGSQAIAQYYEKEGYTVRAMMQLDMTMWAGYSPPTHIGLVEDFVSKKMTDWVKLLVDTYSDLDWVATKCGYACSDHASWTKIGVDSCFPFEGTFAQRSPYIHSANDDLTHVTYTHGLEFAKIALGNLIELSFIDIDNN